MRLKVSGDKPEIRQHYIPALLPRLVKPLIDVGAVSFSFNIRHRILMMVPPQSAVEEVIEVMDDYFLSKEEWDTIVELGLDQNKDDIILKKISTATKTNLTRKCVFSLNITKQQSSTLNLGTTRRSIQSRSTKRRSSVKCRRSWLEVRRPILRTHLM
jgi:hypothetical protein